MNFLTQFKKKKTFKTISWNIFFATWNIIYQCSFGFQFCFQLLIKPVNIFTSFPLGLSLLTSFSTLYCLLSVYFTFSSSAFFVDSRVLFSWFHQNPQVCNKIIINHIHVTIVLLVLFVCSVMYLNSITHFYFSLILCLSLDVNNHKYWVLLSVSDVIKSFYNKNIEINETQTFRSMNFTC